MTAGIDVWNINELFNINKQLANSNNQIYYPVSQEKPPIPTNFLATINYLYFAVDSFTRYNKSRLYPCAYF